MKIDKNVLKLSIGGFAVGVINGLFGAGGGMLAVPLLKSSGMPQKNAHASSIAIILPLCVLSAALYFLRSEIDWKTSLIMIPFGLVGALIGAYIMKKISPKWLSRIFALFLIYGGAKMIIGG